jgi:hypothetical protein
MIIGSIKALKSYFLKYDLQNLAKEKRLVWLHFGEDCKPVLPMPVYIECIDYTTKVLYYVRKTLKPEVGNTYYQIKFESLFLSVYGGISTTAIESKAVYKIFHQHYISANSVKKSDTEIRLRLFLHTHV